MLKFGRNQHGGESKLHLCGLLSVARYDGGVLRRAGYILGLLFVLACVAAYPLTWGRIHVLRRHSPDRVRHVSVTWGGMVLGTSPSSRFLGPQTGWKFRSGGAVYVPQPLWLPGFGFDAGYNHLFVPLWMPAMSVSLFMAWRWRRSRRRQATGFEVERLHH
jgi:hypothetical protein